MFPSLIHVLKKHKIFRYIWKSKNIYCIKNTLTNRSVEESSHSSKQPIHDFQRILSPCCRNKVGKPWSSGRKVQVEWRLLEFFRCRFQLPSKIFRWSLHRQPAQAQMRSRPMALKGWTSSNTPGNTLLSSISIGKQVWNHKHRTEILHHVVRSLTLFCRGVHARERSALAFAVWSASYLFMR